MKPITVCRSTLAVVLCGLLFSLPSCAVPQTRSVPVQGALAPDTGEGSSLLDVPTQHNNSQRTGASLSETILTPEMVGSGRFQRLFDWEVDGQIYAQPLYVSRVRYQGRLISMVIVATMNNTVYAFEAPAPQTDTQPARTPLWYVGNKALGAPLPYNYFSMEWGILGHNIEPLIGITATPVIDRQRGTVYVTAKSGRGGFLGLGRHASYRLVAIDLWTGNIKNSVEITASYRGPDGSESTFEPKFHLQRASLLEANDRIYAAFASHQDTLPYHGWLLAYDADNLKQVAAYCTTCGRVKPDKCKSSSCMGGIWHAGGGPASDRDGNLYVMTGNGTFDQATGDRGTSFIKLDKELNVLGSWTPVTYDCLNRTDSDLGSAGPTFMSDASVLIGGGKEGLLYAIKPEALQGTHVGTGNPAGAQEPCKPHDPIPHASGPGYWSIQAAPKWQDKAIMDILRGIEPTVLSQGFHHIHGSPVQWTVHDARGDRSLLYLSAERDILRAYEFDDGFVRASPPGQDPVDTYHSKCPNSRKGMPGGFLTVSALGSKPESGIVWATMPRRDKDALHHIVPGVLRAYKAYPDHGDELVEIWNSDNGTEVGVATCEDAPPSGTTEVGLFAKYVPPTVAEGKVYVATFSNRLAVYGLEEATTVALAATQTAAYDARLQAAALPASVEPGGTVAIVITATNTGTASWRAADVVSLGSQVIPNAAATVTGDKNALTVQSDVPPGQTYTFSFRIVVPKAEATYHYSWRLERTQPDLKHPTGNWFGKATPEWVFATLRSECAELRQKADGLVAQLHPGHPIPPSTQAEISAVRENAERRHCALFMDHSETKEQLTH